MILSQEIEEAREEVARCKNELRAAEERYHKALQSDDPVSELAFRLYQRSVLAEPDWPEDEPVTWEDWWDLQIDSERNEWLEEAAFLIDIAQEMA